MGKGRLELHFGTEIRLSTFHFTQKFELRPFILSFEENCRQVLDWQFSSIFWFDFDL